MPSHLQEATITKVNMFWVFTVHHVVLLVL